MYLRRLHWSHLIVTQNVHVAPSQSNVFETDVLAQWCYAMLCMQAFSDTLVPVALSPGPRCNSLVTNAISWSMLQSPGSHCDSLVPVAIPWALFPQSAHGA